MKINKYMACLTLTITCSCSEKDSSVKDNWSFKQPVIGDVALSTSKIEDIDINDDFDFTKTNTEEDLKNTTYSFESVCVRDEEQYRKDTSISNSHTIQAAYILPEKVLFNPYEKHTVCSFKIKATHSVSKNQSSQANISLNSLTVIDKKSSSAQIKKHSQQIEPNGYINFEELSDYSFVSKHKGPTQLTCERFSTQPASKETSALNLSIINYNEADLLNLVDTYSPFHEKTTQLCRLMTTENHRKDLSHYYVLKFQKPKPVINITPPTPYESSSYNTLSNVTITNSENIALQVLLPLHIPNYVLNIYRISHPDGVNGQTSSANIVVVPSDDYNVIVEGGNVRLIIPPGATAHFRFNAIMNKTRRQIGRGGSGVVPIESLIKILN